MQQNYYVTVSGDQWDGVALKTMGSEMFKDKLMKANLMHRELYIFPAGITLFIPEVKALPSETLPPWKRG
jgi:hypothetical protein